MPIYCGVYMKSVYSVHDLKSGYGHPHLANNNPDAIRQFTMAIQNEPNSMYKNSLPTLF